jgi:sugar/nucleoside kinase (ribokinase family)
VTLDPGILVIGDVMLDVVAAPCGPLETGTDTPAEISLAPGGSGANTAAWLAHFGAAVTFVGRAGANDAGWHAAALREHGVEPLVARDEARRTGVLVSIISADGERSFLTDRGANDGLSRSDLPDSLLDRIGLVHVSAYAFTHPEPRAAVLAFLASAAARAIPITIDPGSVSLVRELGARRFLDWTRGARICFPNEPEAAFLSQTTDPADQLTILARRYELVVIKRGAGGASAASAGHSWTQTAPRVEVVDSTGAGDAFVAAFLCAYVRGAAVDVCLRDGVAAGAGATAWYGGRPTSPPAVPTPPVSTVR